VRHFPAHAVERKSSGSIADGTTRTRDSGGASPSARGRPRRPSTPASLSAGMSAGGGGGGAPRMFASSHRPRIVTDVRLGQEVTVRTLPGRAVRRAGGRRR
jgi:hypothetical protein